MLRRDFELREHQDSITPVMRQVQVDEHRRQADEERLSEQQEWLRRETPNLMTW